MANFFDAIQWNAGEVIDRLDTCTEGKIVTTTKGDMIVDYGIQTRRFPVGASGQVLTVDPTASSCIRWRDPTEFASGVISTVLSDRRPVATTGGPARSDNNFWNTRYFNYLIDTEGGREGTPSKNGAELIGAQIHLNPGAYFIIGFFPVSRVDNHKTRLRHIAGTNQRSTVTINSIPISPGMMGLDPENFVIYTRSVIFSVWYNVDNNNPTLLASEIDDHYATNDFVHIKVDTTSADTTTQVANKTATAIVNSSWNTYINTSSNIFFTASNSGNILIIDYKEIGPIFANHDGTNSPGTGNWVYTIATAGTFTIDENERIGTASQSNSGNSQASTITSNIFHELVINSSGIYELQHRVQNGEADANFTNINFGSNEDLGAPAGFNELEIYSNCILHKIA